MVYTRGSAEDYDRWADVTGDSGWSWHSLLPYFFKVRNNLLPFLIELTDRRTKNGRRLRTTMTRVVNSIPPYTVHTESTLSASAVLDGPFSRIKSLVSLKAGHSWLLLFSIFGPFFAFFGRDPRVTLQSRSKRRRSKMEQKWEL